MPWPVLSLSRYQFLSRIRELSHELAHEMGEVGALITV